MRIYVRKHKLHLIFVPQPPKDQNQAQPPPKLVGDIIEFLESATEPKGIEVILFLLSLLPSFIC